MLLLLTTDIVLNNCEVDADADDDENTTDSVSYDFVLIIPSDIFQVFFCI